MAGAKINLSWNKILDILTNGPKSVKIGHNTWLSSEKRDPSLPDLWRVSVRLHNTDIVKLFIEELPNKRYECRSVHLDTGGYNTVTTKARMNAVLSALDTGVGIYQKDWQWYVSGVKENDEKYRDGYWFEFTKRF